MVTAQEVQRQLQAIGAEFKYWGKAEAKELPHIIVPNEKIMYCLNGRYDGGFAMICVTDQRIILIDKKPMYLTLEDIRYDMVAEVDFNQRLLNSTISICTVNKKLNFTSYKSTQLRQATSYIQNRVMEFRQQHMMPLATQLATVAGVPVASYEHKIINPYTRAPLTMRRRLSRFPSN